MTTHYMEQVQMKVTCWCLVNIRAGCCWIGYCMNHGTTICPTNMFLSFIILLKTKCILIYLKLLTNTCDSTYHLDYWTGVKFLRNSLNVIYLLLALQMRKIKSLLHTFKFLPSLAQILASPVYRVGPIYFNCGFSFAYIEFINFHWHDKLCCTKIPKGKTQNSYTFYWFPEPKKRFPVS